MFDLFDWFHAALNVACGNPYLRRIMFRQIQGHLFADASVRARDQMTLLVKKGIFVAVLYHLGSIPVDGMFCTFEADMLMV